jgi:hypothetical protein
MVNKTLFEAEKSGTTTAIQNEGLKTFSPIDKENPIILRAFRRLKESQINDNHVSHYTKHSSYSTKHSSTW